MTLLSALAAAFRRKKTIHTETPKSGAAIEKRELRVTFPPVWELKKETRLIELDRTHVRH